MYTKNHYVLQALNTKGLITNNNNLKWNETLGNLVNLSGGDSLNSNTSLPSTTSSGLFENANVLNNYDLIVGSSDEKESLDDYSLKSQITDLTKVNLTGTLIGYIKDDKTNVLITKSLINNTENQIVIKEVGYTKQIYGGNGSLINTFLFARNVLDNPITVEPGKTVTVSMTLEL